MITITAATYEPIIGSLNVNNTLEQHSTCDFSIIDNDAAYSFSKGEPVEVVDDDSSLVLFVGFIDKATEVKLPGNIAKIWSIACIDNSYLVSKRIIARTYENQYAGDIVADLCRNYFSSEGVSAVNASRTDSNITDWGSGTLTSTQAFDDGNGGALQLAPAGSVITNVKTTTSDFSGGTLAGTSASSNSAILATVTAFQIGGANTQSSNSHFYNDIWSGTYTIVSGDQLVYEVWASGPVIVTGIDAKFSDATTLRGTSLTDQNSLGIHPSTDISAFANQKWYKRTFTLTTLAGKIFNTVQAAFEGDSSGYYQSYFRRVLVVNGGTTKVTFYNGTLNQTTLAASANGGQVDYQSFTKTDGITTYETSGTWTSPGIDIHTATNWGSGALSWNSSLPTNATNALYTATILGSSPIRYYTLSESNGTVMIDSSTSAQNGAYIASPSLAQTGPIPSLSTNYGVGYDGVNEYSTVPVTGLPTGNANWSLECWFNISAAPSSSAVLVNFGSWGTTRAAPHIGVSTGGGVYAGTFSGDTTASAAVPLNAWNHAVATWDGTNLRCYVNGVNTNSATPGTLSIGSHGATLAGNEALTTNRYPGLLGQVAFYSTTLSATTIRAHYSAGLAPTASIGTAITAQYEVSTNGGSSYGSLVSTSNGVNLTAITNGQSLTSYFIKYVMTLTNDTDIAAIGPALNDATLLVTPSFAASGTRTSPSLSLSTLSTAGSSQVSWDATIPSGGSLTVQTSVDNGSTWQTISSSGDPVPNILLEQTAVIDRFDYDSSGNYTVLQGAGSIAVDVPNSQLVITANASQSTIWSYGTSSYSDVELIYDLNVADSFIIPLRWTDGSNRYYIAIYDNVSAVANGKNATGYAELFKTVSGTQTSLGSSNITFTRGGIARFKVDAIGTSLVVSLNGTAIISAIDSAWSSGKMGFGIAAIAPDGANLNSFWLNVKGQPLAGKTVLTKVTLVPSTDKSTSTVVQDLTVSFRAPNIDTGALIVQATFVYAHGDACLDELATQSDCVWYIDSNKTLWFKNRETVAAPFAVTSSMMLDQTVSVSDTNPNYRNQQYIVGGQDVTDPQTETQKGDGAKTSFTMPYPIAKAPTVTVNGIPQTVGIKGIDDATPGTNNFYWADNDPVLAQDSTDTPLLDTDTLVVVFQGFFSVVVVTNDATAINDRKTIEGGTTSGLVEEVDSATQATSKDAAFQIANARLDKFKVLGHTLTFQTRIGGLVPGQILPVFLPEHNIIDQLYLIESVTTSDSSGMLFYTITATDGPVDSTWINYFADLARAQKTIISNLNVGEGTILPVTVPEAESWSWGESVSQTVFTCPICNTTTLCGTTVKVC